MFTTAQVFQGFINFWNLVRLIFHKLQDSPVLLSYCIAVLFQVQAWLPSSFTSPYSGGVGRRIHNLVEIWKLKTLWTRLEIWLNVGCTGEFENLETRMLLQRYL
jgi:hypothetical protein